MADPRNLDPKKPGIPVQPLKSSRPDDLKPGMKRDDPKPAPGKPVDKDKPKPVARPASERLVSLDAFRGIIMLFMASAGFGFKQVYDSFKEAEPDTWWRLLASQVDHVPWRSLTNIPAELPLYGFSLWDMIQPAFMFMVGVAAPFSYARRRARGDSYIYALWHALVRSVALVLLGVFLSSMGNKQTNWAFMNVLSQIGLGYMFVFLMVNRPRWLQVGVIISLLGLSWWAFYQYPLPEQALWPELGVTAEVEATGGILTGVQEKWSEHINFAADVDRQFLNRFPRETPFVFNKGGYQTLNFVPALATMLLGLLIGQLMHGPREPGRRLRLMLVWGLVLIVLGVAAHFTICPIVKRIWTPSWTLYSGGIVIWMLAAFYAVIDVLGWRWWSFPLVVVGMNSIVMYMMSQMLKPWTTSTLKTHFSLPYQHVAEWANARWNWTLPEVLFTGTYGPIMDRCSVLFVFWLVCFWLYRQRIFVRI